MSEKNDYLIIGKIIKPFGVKGEVKVFPITDNAGRYEELEFVVLKNGDSFDKVEVEGLRYLNEYVLLKLKNFDTRNHVEELRGKYLYVARENAVKLDDSSYYYYDLIGCSVRTLSGDILGDVYNIQNTGSCDIYFVRSQDEGKKELLVPAISQVIKKIDIAEKEIIIEVIDGLF